MSIHIKTILFLRSKGNQNMFIELTSLLLRYFCNVCYHASRIRNKAPALMNLAPGVTCGSPLSIDTKISTNVLSMIWLWLHNWCYVRNNENCQKSSTSRVFKVECGISDFFLQNGRNSKSVISSLQLELAAKSLFSVLSFFFFFDSLYYRF